MRAALPLACALLAAAALAAATARPAAAAEPPPPVIGIGEQNPDVFTDPYFEDLGIRHVRVIVPWDALHVYWQLLDLDEYMREARKAGVRVLLGFGRSRRYWRRKEEPSVDRFRREFLAFRARYPWVRDYLTWNEANHCGEPTCNKPGLVARYYKVMKANCPGCKIVAADLLDTPRMTDWLRGFQKRAGPGKHIWGLHNYLDANRFRTKGTEALLKAAPKGEIWFTETGGLVVRRNRSTIAFPGSIRHAAAKPAT